MERSSEQQTSLELMEGAPFAVARVDRAGTVLAWNAAAERMFAVGRGEAVGRPIAAVVPVPGGEGAWQSLLAMGPAGRQTWTTRRADQRSVTCAWTVHPLRDGGAACYGQELAAPGAEAAQQRIRDILLRALLDNLDIIAWVLDPKGEAVLHEGKGLGRLGWGPGQLAGQNFLELFGERFPELHAGMAGEFVHFFVEEGGGHFENWQIPMYGADGELAALCGVSLDVTDAKRRELELQEKIDVIERQQAAMRDMSTPIIEVWDQVICLPIVGLVDTARAADVMDGLLQAVTRTRARYAILDLTGVDVVDTSTASHLLALIRALRLLGAEGVLTGIHPNIAQTIVALGVDLSGLIVRATLRDALKHVLVALERRSRGPRAGA